MTIINHQFPPCNMARRRSRRKNYKQTTVETVSVGSAGEQILIGYFQPIDVEGSSMSAYLNNINLSLLLNDAESEGSGGFIAYLTTNGSWAEADVITARAGNFADTVSLAAKRTIKSSVYESDRNDGVIALWIEISDITITTDVDVRVVMEAWGRFLRYITV